MNILNDTNFSLLESFTSKPEGQYHDYLKEHISNVQKGYDYLKKNLPDIFSDLEIPMDEMDKQIKEHDKSKWSEDEYEPYVEHFYGKNKGKNNDPEFEIAWEHHYNNNPHHPEFWSGKDMPLSCIIEMICDWWSFSWKKNDLFEIFKYYNGNDKPQLTDATKSKVEEILRELRNNLQKYSSTTLEKLTEEIENYKKDKKVINDLINQYKSNNFFYGSYYITQKGEILDLGNSGYGHSTISEYLNSKGMEIDYKPGMASNYLKSLGWIRLNTKIKYIEIGEIEPTEIQYEKLLDAINFMGFDIQLSCNNKIEIYKNNSRDIIKNIKHYFKTGLLESYFKTKDIIDTSKFKAIEKLISGSHKILITRHIAPDADAIFSAKALCIGIKEKYPKKEVILGNEKTTEYLNEYDLLIVLDLGVATRIASQYIGNPKIIRIDHHPDGTLKADIDLEVSNAGSTSEIITLFLSEMGYKITKEMAEGLFKGIITDTGRMQYSLNQTTLAAMSILTDLGIDYKKLYNEIYIKDEISIKSKAYILNNYKRTPNGVAYLFVDKARAKEAGIDIEKTIKQVYELSEIRDCPIWVILRENGHGEINLSVRSRIIPINQIAKLFGGGGHDNAAAIKVKSRKEAKDILMKLDSYIKEMKIKIPNLK